MRVTDYVRTGQTNLRRARLRTGLTVFAIVIGTFTLAMTTAFVQGVQTFVTSQIRAFAQPDTLEIGLQANQKGDRQSSNGVPVYNPSRSTVNQITYMNSDDLKKIQTTPDITGAYPEYGLDVDYIQYGTSDKYIFAAQALFPGVQPVLSTGSVFDPTDQSAVLIPFPYVQALGFATPSDAIGKTVTVQVSQLPSTPSSPSAMQTKQVMLTVSGVLSETLHVSGGYVSYNLASSLYSFEHNNVSNFSRIYATTTPNLSSSRIQQISDSLTGQSYTVHSYVDALNQFDRVIRIVRWSLSGFAGVALLAAMIGIINTLLMAVYERTQEIGLMKALGMKRRGIFAIFLSEAAIIGFWGGVVGVILAVLASSIVNKILVRSVFSGFPGHHILSFAPLAMIEIVLGAMALGIIAGALPAVRASRLDPIEALRRE